MKFGRMPSMGGGRMIHSGGSFKTPTMPKMARPMKIHPAATKARIRLPQGTVNTGEADPAPYLPGVGKI